MSEPTQTRVERLAQQLRANLRRRKMKARVEEEKGVDLSKGDRER